MEAIIYKIVNDLNDKVYVGQTWETSHKRFSRHCAEARWRKTKNMPIVLAIKKYGKEHFRIEVLEVLSNPTQVEVDYREISWGTELNSLAPNGYNLRLGKAKGKFSEETKIKIGNANRGKKRNQEAIENMRVAHLGYRMKESTKRKLSEINTGKKLSDSHKRKLSEINTGKKLSDSHKRNITNSLLKFSYEVTSPNQEMYYTDNLKKWCKEFDLYYNGMLRVASGERSHHKKWKVRITGELK